MGMLTPLLDARRIVEKWVERVFTHLPRPLLDRLIALRVAYPNTPPRNICPCLSKPRSNRFSPAR